MLVLTFYYLVMFCIATAKCGGHNLGIKSPTGDEKAVKLPPCRLCKVLISSFKKEVAMRLLWPRPISLEILTTFCLLRLKDRWITVTQGDFSLLLPVMPIVITLYRQARRQIRKGLHDTSTGNFEGGDVAWEEEKLISYAKSEVRLTEIEEGLCFEIDRGQDQCFTLAVEAEHLLEKWFYEEQYNNPDMEQWLCVEQLKVCCPVGFYGGECKPCPGYPDNICSNNGNCKGNGTRKGSGTCSCHDGYTGEMCDQCEPNYYISYQDENHVLCTKCHSTCEGNCTEAGRKGCISCKPGWYKDSERGCLDVNECFFKEYPCQRNEFCVNNEGSYSCLACDHACDGCQGDGPDMCHQCAEGFVLESNLCVDKKKISTFETARYLTYLGLCVATCIIFQKNPILASIIGLCVAMYVSVSVYMSGDVPLNSIFAS